MTQYSGWGGLRDAIYDRQTFKQLMACVSREELQSIKSTTRGAYYTPTGIVDFIYAYLQCAMTEPPKRLLEPSAGQGRFIERLPENWKLSAHKSLVEIDAVSCQFLKKLYPEADVFQQGFETFQSQEKFDLIVGNPPYGQTFLQDSRHTDLSAFSVHHYFVAKCMRLLNEGGMLAMVLPRYFLDNKNKHVRHIIAKEGGHLLAAFRLPYDMFDDAKVTVDIVFLQKRTQAEPAALWTESNFIRNGQQRASLNRYFIQNPDRVLGKLTFLECYGRPEIQCERQGGNEELWKKLLGFVPRGSLNAAEPVAVAAAPAATDKTREYLQDRLSLLLRQHATLQQEINRLQSILN